MEENYPELASERSYKSCKEFELSQISSFDTVSRYSFISLANY